MQLNVIGTQVGTVVDGNTMSSTTKHRAYLLTINNYTQNDINALNNDKHYCMYQIERGEQGTVHIQAFIYYTNPRVWPKSKYPSAHIEVARNIDQCIKYCSKEDTRVEGPFEIVNCPKPEQGRRRDLETIAKSIMEGTTLPAIAIEDPVTYIRYFRGLQALANIHKPHRSGPPITIWLWGLAGAGKTKYVFDHHTSVYVKDQTQWWDGYNHEETIVIDDFDGKWPFRDLLRLLDRYPYQGQVKGGYVKITSPNIYITCEYHPRDIFEGNDNTYNQVSRRLNKIIRVAGNGTSLSVPIEETIEL